MSRKHADADSSQRMSGFEYLDTNMIYMDTACQSLRPQPVIDALTDYYTGFNACGGRVKYAWGQKVDGIIEDTRKGVLDLLGLNAKNYSVSFTLNTTYGINLLLTQLADDSIEQVITSEIEHNSTFLPTIELAQRIKAKRVVLPRDDMGALLYDAAKLKNAVIVVNAVSNIDGRRLVNIQELVRDAHKAGSIVIIDAAQTMAHHHDLLYKIEADAICFSAHKMYAPSLGVVVVRKTLLEMLNASFVGGGMVQAVSEQSYELTDGDFASRLEPGLQAFGEIVAFGEALTWLKSLRGAHEQMQALSKRLYDGLAEIPGLTLLNKTASPVIALHSSVHDAHRLATFLSAQNIMVRSGYFCCHYYLNDVMKLPPLVRFSIGLHTTEGDIDTVLKAMRKLQGKG